MAARKKSTKAKTESANAPVIVTQVVEEVNEIVDTKPLEEIKEDAQHIEEKVQELEDGLVDIQNQKKTEESKENKPVDDEKNPEELTEELPKTSPRTVKEGHRKDTVNELFQKETGDVMPEISVYKDKKSNTIVVWAAMVIVVALLTGSGLFLATRGMPKMPFFAKTTPAPSPSPSPTTTPQALNRSDLKLQVLNGGGVAGAGSKMKKILEDKGFSVSDVGNSEDFSYKTTSILVKPTKLGFLDLLQGDLKDSYTIGTAAATLPDDVSYDARVIVGKE